MSDVLSQYLAQSGLGARLQRGKVFDAWAKAVGTQGRRTRAVRFRDGELTVEVQSAALLQELRNFTGEDLRRRTNAHLGTEKVRRIDFQLER
jgi:predicted nucleic acid-binding Zn ribbon protein